MSEQVLTAFVESVCGDSHLRVETDLGDGFVRLRSAEAERRQAAHDIRSTEDIVIEMLRNARDAQARNIFVAAAREGDRRRIVMLDDGCGIPPSLHERVFEPRVTSKLDTMHMDKWGVHGRGMALYSITVNAEVARVVSSSPNLGSSLLVETDLSRIGEKSDQSTFPSFEQTSPESFAMRGPRNILRTTCEFALEHRNECSVYFGSVTDVAATLYAFGLATLSAAKRAFCEDIEGLPVCKRLATSADPASFAHVAETIGLCVSERSARRIMDGTIPPLESLLERMQTESFAGARGGKSDPNATSLDTAEKHVSPHQDGSSLARSLRDSRGFKLSAQDASHLKDVVRDAFSDIAQRYYLEGDVVPVLRVGKNAIHITIPLEKLR